MKKNDKGRKIFIKNFKKLYLKFKKKYMSFHTKKI